ncbi:hypothetical protein AB0C96_40110 [Streptomyces sp. NPDC048506]
MIGANIGAGVAIWFGGPLVGALLCAAVARGLWLRRGMPRKTAATPHGTA